MYITAARSIRVEYWKFTVAVPRDCRLGRPRIGLSGGFDRVSRRSSFGLHDLRRPLLWRRYFRRSSQHAAHTMSAPKQDNNAAAGTGATNTNGASGKATMVLSWSLRRKYRTPAQDHGRHDVACRQSWDCMSTMTPRTCRVRSPSAPLWSCWCLWTRHVESESSSLPLWSPALPVLATPTRLCRRLGK